MGEILAQNYAVRKRSATLQIYFQLNLDENEVIADRDRYFHCMNKNVKFSL